MKKMVLLASVVALAALMLAAAPAFAQGNLPAFREVGDFLIKPGDCGVAEDRFDAEQLTRAQTLALPGVNAGNLPGGVGTPFFCVIEDGDFVPPDGVVDDGRDGRDGRVDRDGDGFFDDLFDEPFIEQEIEQEAESGPIDQDFTVTGGGDNSNQTVGIQGVANTGNVQNAIGVVDAGDFAGDFAGDEVYIGDDDEFFEDDDGRLVCRDDFGNLINNDVRCIIVDDGVFGDDFFDDGDNINVFGDDDFVVRGFGDGDDGLELEEVGADITMSPVQNVTGNNQVNQAAAASGDGNDCDGVLVWDAHWQTWVCTPA